MGSGPALWDTGEAQTVPWIFGIMHPTGFPAFTLLAGIFAHAVPFGSVAWRIGIFSALAMSGAAWLVYRIAAHLQSDRWLACGAAWLFAFGDVAWTRGTRAEVHALALFFALAAIDAAVRFLHGGETRALVLGAFAWGLGLATHPIVALLAPALMLVLLERLRSVRLRFFAAALAAIILGLACYAYLPLRSAVLARMRADPTLSLGIPAGRPFWDNDHPSTLRGFVREVAGSEYGAGGTFARMLKPATYAEGLPKYLDALLAELTPPAVLFALIGLGVLWRRSDATALVVLMAFVFPTAFALAYTIEADPLRYDLIGYALIAVCAACGTSWLVRALASPRYTAPLIACLAAAVLLVLNRDDFAQRGSPGYQAVIDSVVKKTPGDAILITPWLDATTLAYGAYVEHRLGNRILETAWLSDDASRVPAWTKTRPVFVVGRLFGSVPGFQIRPIADGPHIYAIVRSRASAHSR